jgi:hypothetical protein
MQDITLMKPQQQRSKRVPAGPPACSSCRQGNSSILLVPNCDPAQQERPERLEGFPLMRKKGKAPQTRVLDSVPRITGIQKLDFSSGCGRAQPSGRGAPGRAKDPETRSL